MTMQRTLNRFRRLEPELRLLGSIHAVRCKFGQLPLWQGGFVGSEWGEVLWVIVKESE